MNDLIPAPTTLPGIVEDEVDSLVGAFVNSILTERGYDQLPRLPSKMERAAMQSRRDRLARKLAPINESMTQQDDIVQELGRLWVRFPALRNADVGVMTSAYLEDLARFPLFAAMAAIADVRDRRIKSLDPDWPPTSPRLVEAAEKHVEPVAVAFMRVGRVLKIDKVAIPNNPDMQRKVKTEILGFIADRKTDLTTDEARYREDVCKPMASTSARFILEEYRALGIEPIKGLGGHVLSPTLARKLGMLASKHADDR